VAQNQRERILAAVADVVTAASYAEMTVEDIIVTAGVSRRTFYEHFKNKDDAFIAAYEEAAGRLLAAVRAASQSREGFAERMHTGIGTFLGLLAANPAFARMCIVEVLAAGPDAVQRRNAAMQSFATMIEENAQELLDETSPSKLTAETVVGGIYDVIYTRIQQGEIRQLPDLTSDLVRSALVYYLPPDAVDAAAAEPDDVKPPPAPATPGAP
jgi:AcrR family transcriptional regulator